MTLDASGMKDDIQAALDSADTAAEKATAWGAALGSYAADVVPATAPGAAVAAGTVLGTALVTAFANTNATTGAAAAEAAFTAFGAAIGLAMLPAYTGVGPAGSVGLLAIFQKYQTETVTTSSSAQDIADAVQAWMETGSATLVASPFTPIPAWS